MITGDEFRWESGLILDVSYELVSDEDMDAAGPQHVDVSQLCERQTHQSRDLHTHLVTGQGREVDGLVDQRRILHAHIHRPAHKHSYLNWLFTREHTILLITTFLRPVGPWKVYNCPGHQGNGQLFLIR